MTKEEIKNKAQFYQWEHWVDRSFGAFITSIALDIGVIRSEMKEIGVNTELPPMLFQKGAFYKCDKNLWDRFSTGIQKYLDDGGSIFEIVKKCEECRAIGIEKIEKIKKSTISIQEKLLQLKDLQKTILSHIWLTHGFEHLYSGKFKKEISKYFSGDPDKFIGDISYPVKKNTHNYFEEALRSNQPIEGVLNNFAWIKVRDGFSTGFTKEELQEERERLQKLPSPRPYIYPKIPSELEELAKISRELVYYRTLRTDIWHELLYLSRPILCEVAKEYKMEFEELRDYTINSLAHGKPEYFEYNKFSAVVISPDFAIFPEIIIIDKSFEDIEELKGVSAFKGKVLGRTRIAMTAHQADKVEEGEILVAPTTAPSYIMAMKRASAFITDEGGITSHAAIVSRELKKPCIIGTKFATKILKDGDTVEVDANNGIVRLLKS